MALYIYVSVLWGALIMLTGIPGNLLILCTYSKKKNRTSAHVFILALATCDTFACLVLPLSMYNWIHEFTFINDNLCKATLSTRFLRSFLELFLTGALAVDRYCAVTDPAKRFNISQAATIVSVCTLLCAVISLPSVAIFGINIDLEADKSSCEVLGPVWAADVFYTFEIICYVLVFITIVILSVLLYISALKSHRRALARDALKSSSSVRIKHAWSTTNSANDSDTSICAVNRPSRIPVRKSSTMKARNSNVLVTGVSLMPCTELDIITAEIPSRPPSHQLPPVQPTRPHVLPDLHLPDIPDHVQRHSIQQPCLPCIPEIPGTVPSTSQHQFSRHTIQHARSIPGISSQTNYNEASGRSSAHSAVSFDSTRRRKLVSSLTKTLIFTCLATMTTWIPYLIVFIIPNLTEPLRSANNNLYTLVVLAKHFCLLSYSMKAFLYASFNVRFYEESGAILDKIRNFIC